MKETPEERDLRIETAIGKNLAKYWYEKAKARHVKLATPNGDIEAVLLDDLASILEQLPEREKQPEVKGVDGLILKSRAKEILLKLVKDACECAKGQKGLELELHVDNIIGNIYPDFGVALYDEPQDITAAEMLEALKEWCGSDWPMPNTPNTLKQGNCYGAKVLLEFAEQWLLQKRKV